MNKRGKKSAQTAVFIVIAILIIAIGGIALIFKNKINLFGFQNKNTMSPEIQSIDSAIETCFDQRTIDAIRIIGLQGGYVNLPSNYLKTNLSNIAYGYYNGKNTLASKSIIEKEISSYIEFTMPFCIEDEFQDFNITKSSVTINTKIKNSSVLVSAKMPISATKGNMTFVLDRNYDVEIPIKLGDMIDVANTIVQKTIQDPKYIDLSYLGNNQYTIILSPADNKNIVYSITDDKSETDDIPYTFVFGVKLI
jgi:hypothetical protein